MWQVIRLDNDTNSDLYWSDGQPDSAIRGQPRSSVELLIGNDALLSVRDGDANRSPSALRLNGVAWPYSGVGQLSLRLLADRTFSASGSGNSVSGHLWDLQTAFREAFEAELFPIPHDGLVSYITNQYNTKPTPGPFPIDFKGDPRVGNDVRKVASLVVNALLAGSVGAVGASLKVSIDGAVWLCAALAHAYTTPSGAFNLTLMTVACLSPPPHRFKGWAAGDPVLHVTWLSTDEPDPSEVR